MSEEEEKKSSNYEAYKTHWAELNENIRHNHAHYNTIIMSISSAIIGFNALSAKSIIHKWSSIFLGLAITSLVISFFTGNIDIEETQKMLYDHHMKEKELKTTKWKTVTIHLNCFSAIFFTVGLFLFIFSR